MIQEKINKLIPFISENFITYPLWEEGKYIPFLKCWQKADTENRCTRLSNKLNKHFEKTGYKISFIGKEHRSRNRITNAQFKTKVKMKDESSTQVPKQALRKTDVICCGVLERMQLGWMKLEDGTRCMPYIKGHSDENMYRVNNCPSCGKYVRDVMVEP